MSAGVGVTISSRHILSPIHTPIFAFLDRLLSRVGLNVTGTAGVPIWVTGDETVECRVCIWVTGVWK